MTDRPAYSRTQLAVVVADCIMDYDTDQGRAAWTDLRTWAVGHGPAEMQRVAFMAIRQIERYTGGTFREWLAKYDNAVAVVHPILRCCTQMADARDEGIVSWRNFWEYEVQPSISLEATNWLLDRCHQLFKEKHQ